MRHNCLLHDSPHGAGWRVWGYTSCVRAARVTFTSARRGEAAALPDRRAASFYAPLGLLRRLCPRSNPPRPDHRVPRAPDGSRGNSRGRKLRTTAVEIGDGGGGREKGQEDGGKMKEMKTKGGEKGRGRGSGSGGRILPNSHSAAELKSG